MRCSGFRERVLLMSKADEPDDAGAPLSREALWRILPVAAQEPYSAGSRPCVTRPAPDPILKAKTEWESAVDALTQLVIVLDEQGHVVRVNRTLERWKIGDIANTNGRTLHELLHPGCQSAHCYLLDAWTNAEDELARDGTWSREIEDTILARRLAIEMRTLATLVSSGDAGSRVVVLVEDVTSRRQTESRLRQGHAMLEQLVSARARDALHANSKLRQEIDVRRQTEQSLRKSEECYRRLVDTMIEGLVVHDPEGIIVYANESLCQMLGVARSEIVGEPAESLLPGVHRCTASQVAHEHMICPCGRYEANWRHKSGESITVLVSPKRLDAPSGEFLGCFAVVMDITARVRSERAMRMLSAQLLGAQEMERKRIANELHDSIGQTLGALKFVIEGAVGKATEGDTVELSRLLEGLVPKLQSAIDEVRHISLDLRPAMLDDLGVLPTLAWHCREYKNVYQSVELDLKFDLREEEVPSRLKTAIYRIVQEALSNIARHAYARNIQLTLRCHGPLLELTIADDGIGFDSAPFAPDATDRSGLGLRTMRERAESTGGSFQVESRRGEGTRLSVSWLRPGQGE